MRKLTKAQRQATQQALGLDRKRKSSSRNWYLAAVGSPDIELWTELVMLGYAALIRVERGMVRFTVTEAGRRALLSPDLSKGGEE